MDLFFLMQSQTFRKTTHADADLLVWRITMRNKSYRPLSRTEIFCRRRNDDGTVGDVLSPIIMCFRYDGDIPENIVVASHGNSKSHLSFFPATHELLDNVKNAILDNPEVRPGRLFYQVIYWDVLIAFGFSISSSRAHRIVISDNSMENLEENKA